MKVLIVLSLALACVSAATVRDIPTYFNALEGRITNGKPAVPGQFPYQVGLLINRSTRYMWCGGSLISDSWVLTAAHCTEGATEITVYLGSTERQVAQVQYTVSPQDIYQHKDYVPLPLLANDISLIKIPAVKFTPEIQPIKIPAISASYPSYAGDYGVASGWGLTSDEEQYVGYQLNYARLEIVPNSVCVAAYGSKVVTEKILCVATPNGTNTCQGDSGGPLVLENSKLLVGVTSFGSALGCESGNPSGFVRVTSYLDWIKDISGVYY